MRLTDPRRARHDEAVRRSIHVTVFWLLTASLVSGQSPSPSTPASPSAAPSASPATPAAPSPSPAAGITLESLRAKLAANPTDVATMRMLGTGYRKMGKDKDALPLLLHACHLQPKDPRVRAQLSMVLNATGKRKQAYRQYEILKKLDPALAEIVVKVLSQ